MVCIKITNSLNTFKISTQNFCNQDLICTIFDYRKNVLLMIDHVYKMTELTLI